MPRDKEPADARRDVAPGAAAAGLGATSGPGAAAPGGGMGLGVGAGGLGSMASSSTYLRGMLGYVRQTLGMYDEGQTLARVAGLQGLVQQVRARVHVDGWLGGWVVAWVGGRVHGWVLGTLRHMGPGLGPGNVCSEESRSMLPHCLPPKQPVPTLPHTLFLPCAVLGRGDVAVPVPHAAVHPPGAADGGGGGGVGAPHRAAAARARHHHAPQRLQHSLRVQLHRGRPRLPTGAAAQSSRRAMDQGRGCSGRGGRRGWGRGLPATRAGGAAADGFHGRCVGKQVELGAICGRCTCRVRPGVTSASVEAGPGCVVGQWEYGSARVLRRRAWLGTPKRCARVET